jgi:RND family efflux transporter MFP subunit
MDARLTPERVPERVLERADMERARPGRISPELSVATSVRARIVRALLLGLLVSSAGACGRKAAPVSPPQTVFVAIVVQRDTPIYGEWVATLDGSVNAQIEPRVTGYVIKQNYTEGSLVRNGDVLFEIDPRPFKAALDQSKAVLAQAEAQLAKATLDVNRDTPLAAEHAIAQNQLDTEISARQVVQAQVLGARANVEEAALNLEFTRVTSLVTGIAGIARVQVGNLVGPNAVLTTVSQVEPIKAYFTVSEQEYTDFHRRFPTEASVAAQRKKMPLQLILADGTLYERTGTVSFADREVNPATGAIRIAGLFANPNNLLRPGEYGRVRLSAKSQPGALLVPQRAVTELQGSYQVAVVGGDDKISIRPVTVGDRVGQLWIVTDGLKAGERVVVEGQMKVHDGSAVKPVPDSPVTPSAAGG